MATSGKMVWVGRVITALVAFPFLMSGAMKVKGGTEVVQGMGHLGLPEALIMPLAILELACVVIYLIPKTSILGAILLTGYIGCAICSHLRVGDPFYLQIVIGILIWLGPYLREARLRPVLPLRNLKARPAAAP